MKDLSTSTASKGRRINFSWFYVSAVKTKQSSYHLYKVTKKFQLILEIRHFLLGCFPALGMFYLPCEFLVMLRIFCGEFMYFT